MTATIEASTSNEASSEGSGSAASVVLASNAVSTHTDAYVRQVAAPVEGTFFRVDHASSEPPVQIEPGAQILLARENFGCGSSREHAPWALLQNGFQAVIAPSFADIFFNNSFKNGLLLIKLDAATVDRLFKEAESHQGYRLAIDFAEQSITTPGGEAIKFEIDPFRKHCMLNGLDEIGLTLQHADKIKAFEAKRRQQQPWLFN